MTELELRKDIIAVAEGYIGAVRGSDAHHEIIDTYNKNLPRPRSYKVSYNDAWCATFVSAIFYMAGLSKIFPVECSCYYMQLAAARMGIWIENDAYIPKIGDCVLYDWGDSGNGDNTGVPDHVGIVQSVNGNTISVIEGNYSSSVKVRIIKVNSKYIRGYICPDYASVADDTLTDGQKWAIENHLMTREDFDKTITFAQLANVLYALR